MSTQRVEAINLKICGKVCTGYFIYSIENGPEVGGVQVVGSRYTTLYFQTPDDFTSEQYYGFYDSVEENNGIEVEEDGTIYQGILSEWDMPEKGDHSGEIIMINKFINESNGKEN